MVVEADASTATCDIMIQREGLEAPMHLVYLLTLLGFLAAGANLVVRQVGWSVVLAVPTCFHGIEACWSVWGCGCKGQGHN